VTFLPATARERFLCETLRAVTKAPRGVASPANYAVWNGEHEVESEAIGFVRGAERYASLERGGYDFTVRVGTFVVWPDERWGEGES
jgi:hypothetical protein